MVNARDSHGNGHNSSASQCKKSLNHGRVALPRDRFVQSSATFSKRMSSESTVNRLGVFISPAGWRTLAGGNTPGICSISLHPGGVPESADGYLIRPISPIRPIPPHPKSTLAHSKSTVDLGHEPLIKVENGLRPP